MGMRYCRGKEVGARMEMDLYDSIGMGETFFEVEYRKNDNAS